MIEQPVQPTISVRTRSSVQELPQILGPNFGKIMQYIQDSGEKMVGAPYVAYYN